MKNERARRRMRWRHPGDPARPPNDTAVIVPGSELQAIKQWQQRAHRLPGGGRLMVIPKNNTHLQEVGQRIRIQLDRQGRKVTVTTVH